MADISQQQTFVRALNVSTFEEGFNFTHDYGEKYFSWESISHVFGLIYEKKGTLNLPLCIVVARDSRALFCIDGNTTQIRDKDGESSHKKHFTSTVETRKAKEEDLNKLMREICMHSSKTYIDKPLVEYVRGSSINLPSLAVSKEITAYCRKVMESINESDFAGAQVFQAQRRQQKPSIVRKKKEKWKEGRVLEARYTVQQVFQGTLGPVYIVFDPEAVKFFAIKTFHDNRVFDENLIRRLTIQAKIWMKLGRHPHIVQAEMVREIEGRLCIFLEYVLGTDLDQMLKNGPLQITMAIEFALQFCSGMDYAYQKFKIINPDIKPGNCLITRSGILKINDIGLNKIFQGAPASGDFFVLPQEAQQKDSSAAATAMAGTLPYMAPELLADVRKASTQSDIYAFGVLLYELLTGTNPFSSYGPAGIINRHLRQRPEMPVALNPEIPQALSNLVIKCIQKDPARRYSDFPQIMSALREIYGDLSGHNFEPPREEEAFSDEDWFATGSSLAALGRHKEAVISFDWAILLGRSSLDARLCKSSSLMELGRTQEAYAILNEALSFDPGDWKIYASMAEVQWEAGSLAKALEIIEAGLKRSREPFQLLIKKFRVLTRAGRFEEALGTIDESLRISPRNAELLFQRAAVLFSLGYYEECRSTCNAIKEINSHHENSRFLCTTASKKLEEKEKILETINAAIDFDKEFIIKDVNTLLSVFCNVKDALFYLDSIRENPRISYLKACLNLAEGDLEECLKCVGRALKPKTVINDEGNIDMDNYIKSMKESLKDTETQDGALRLKILVGKIRDIKKSASEEPQSLTETLPVEDLRTPELMLLYGLQKLKENKGKEARSLFKLALSHDPHLTACGYFVGKTLEVVGDMGNAIIAYNEFINKFPDSTGYWKEMLASQNIREFKDFERVYYRLIGNFPQFHHYWISYLLYLTVKKYNDKARVIASHLSRSFEEKPDMTRKKTIFWTVQGLLHLFLLRYKDAVQSFQEALRLEEHDLPALVGMFRSCAQGGQPDKAAFYLQKIKACDDNTGIYEYFSSELLIMQRAYEKSLPVLERGLKKNPDNRFLLMRKAQVLLDMRKHEIFFEIFKDLSAQSPDSTPVSMLNIIALIQTERINDALPDLIRTVSGDPANLAGHKNLGFMHICLNQAHEALRTFSSITAMYDRDYEIFLGMGIAHYMLGDLSMAHQSFVQAISLNAAEPDLWQFMGAVSFCQGNSAESEKCWDRALLYGSGFTLAWTNKGFFYYYLKKFSQALELSNKAIRMDQRNVHAWILRAQCQWKLGVMSEALQSIEKANIIAPDNLRGLIARGLLEFHNENYQLSYENLEKASSLDNKNADIWYNRALASLFNDDFEEARRSLERCSAISRFSKAQASSPVRKEEAGKPIDQCSRRDPSHFRELITHYAIESESYAEIAAHSCYEQARQADPVQFKTWAEDLKNAGSPRELLEPLEISSEPFILPINRPLIRMETIELFHYPFIKELFARKPSFNEADSEDTKE
jgi:tetratricopeptide (TPR) repeat protein